MNESAAPLLPIPVVAGHPKILVLMACRNGAAWIDAQIISILDQTSVELRLVARDDCSTDATLVRLSHFAAADARLYFCRADHPSGSAAQNFFNMIRANQAIEFDYVALSDQDDIWNSNKLQLSAEALARSKSAASSTSAVAFWPDARSTVLDQNPSITPCDFLLEGAGQGCTFLMTAEFFGRVREFLLSHPSATQSIHYHDWAIYALARSWKLPWKFIPEATLRYRQHQHNDTGARSSLRGVVFRMRQIRSGWYRDQLLAIARLCIVASPGDKVIRHWMGLLEAAPGWSRRARLAAVVLRTGRRRASDNVALIVSILLGAI